MNNDKNFTLNDSSYIEVEPDSGTIDNDPNTTSPESVTPPPGIDPNAVRVVQQGDTPLSESEIAAMPDSAPSVRNDIQSNSSKNYNIKFGKYYESKWTKDTTNEAVKFDDDTHTSGTVKYKRAKDGKELERTLRFHVEDGVAIIDGDADSYNSNTSGGGENGAADYNVDTGSGTATASKVDGSPDEALQPTLVEQCIKSCEEKVESAYSHLTSVYNDVNNIPSNVWNGNDATSFINSVSDFCKPIMQTRIDALNEAINALDDKKDEIKMKDESTNF